MPDININGQMLFYFEHDALPRFPPLLLIHGAGGQHTHWPPQIRRLAGRRVIAPDLPGHGRSEGEGFSQIPDYADSLIGLLDSLQIDRFIPVGHSMGGAVALQLALDHPERVAAMVLIGTGARLPVGPQILDHTLENYPQVIDFITEYAFSPQVGDDLRRLGRQTLQACPPAVTLNDFLACNRFDVRDRLPELTQPALVLCGSEDRMAPPKFSQYLADHLPQADFQVVEGAGHMLPVERPDQVAAILSGWLANGAI